PFMPMRALQTGSVPERIRRMGKCRDCGAAGPTCGFLSAACGEGLGGGGLACPKRETGTSSAESAIRQRRKRFAMQFLRKDNANHTAAGSSGPARKMQVVP